MGIGFKEWVGKAHTISYRPWNLHMNGGGEKVKLKKLFNKGFAVILGAAPGPGPWKKDSAMRPE